KVIRLIGCATLVVALLFAASGCSRVRISVQRLAPPVYPVPGGLRVAVLPFAGTRGRDEAGEAMANALVSHLSPQGYFKIIERSQVKRILDEQTFSNSDFVNPATAARI